MQPVIRSVPWRLATAAVLALAAAVPAGAQVDMPSALAPVTVTAAPGSVAVQAPSAAAPAAPVLDDATVVDMDRRFNDLRRELLDDRARSLDWWLAATAIFLTLFGVVVAIAGFIGFRRFREIEADARQSAAAARNLVREIEEKRDEAASLLEEITAETADKVPAKADEMAQSVRANPAASPTDRTVAAAIELQRQGNAEGAANKWRAIAEAMEGADNDLAARAWFSVGYLRQGDERLQEATDAYERALRLDPNNDAARNNLGVVKNVLGNHGEAIADYDKVLQLKPEDAGVYNNRGTAKHDLGRHEEAITDYDEALRLGPGYAEAYNNRGVAKHALGRHEEAIADCNEALRLEPNYADAYNERGNVKSALCRHTEAITDYDETIRLKPDHAMAYNNRGNAKNALCRHEEAIADYGQALRLKPDYATAYANRAIAKLHLDRRDEARRDFEAALALARKVGDEALASKVAHNLEALRGGRES